MWLCAQAAPFVCGDTGSIRDLDYVVWEVSYAILLQLVHWRVCASDRWTVAPGDAAATVERITAAAASTPIQM